MNDKLEQLMKLLGGKKPQAPAQKQKSNYNPATSNYLTQGAVQQAMPSRNGGASRSQTPAQRDFPGRTNYGVPEDDMIDTPMGYITAHQYNGLSPVMQGPLQQTQNPQFQHSPHSEGSQLQGRQNWGEIQMQGSRGMAARPLQKATFQPILQNADPRFRNY